MPFAAPIELNEQDPNKKNQAGSVNISGQSASFNANVPGQDSGGSGAQSQQKSSGQYTNIQSYLDANKQQGDQMGQKITSDISQKAEDATQKIQGFQAQAPKVEAYDPNAVIGNAANLNDNEKAQYKTMKQTGGYTGPDSVDKVQGYGDLSKQAMSANQAAKNAGSEVGQQQLLKDAYARPQYSAGENKLDQVLLQNSAGSKANLENVYNKYSGLDKIFNDASANVGSAINQANSQALANKQAFIPAEEAARKALLDPIQKRADEANAKNGGFIDQITGDASDETLSDETLAALGLSEGQNLWDANIADYINPDRSQVGLNNVASADERTKYSALASLFGDPTMNQVDANGKAINPITFNKEKFDKDMSARQAEFEANQKAINDRNDQELRDHGIDPAVGYVYNPSYINGSMVDFQKPFWDRIQAQRAAALADNDSAYKKDRKIKKG